METFTPIDSFSQIHSYAYSIIALQELNLNYFYPKVYWNCACLSVEASADFSKSNDELVTDKVSSTNYGEITKAIYKMKQSGIDVKPPDINKSNKDFTPIEETNTILFGLMGISGINQAIADNIISKRPYTSFKDFYNKHSYKDSIITRSKFVQLIKSGCFDEFDSDRNKIMKQYIVLSMPKKEKLNISNLPEGIKIGLSVPEELLKIYQGKKYICSVQFFYSQHPNFKSKKLYWLDEKGKDFFNKYLFSSMKEDIDYWYENDKIIFVDKSVDKILEPQIGAIKQYLAQPETVTEYNKRVRAKMYSDLFPNTDTNHWSFESCSFYCWQHELLQVDRDIYNLKLFSELPVDPIFITKSYGKREWKQYEIYQIMGTVIDKNDNHHSIYLLDPSNTVVNVKFNAGTYSWYKQQISDTVNGQKQIMDYSWFKRGQLLILTGYRYGNNDFKVKKYKNSIYPHSVEKIDKVYKNGKIKTTSYRYGSDPIEEV